MLQMNEVDNKGGLMFFSTPPLLYHDQDAMIVLHLGTRVSNDAARRPQGPTHYLFSNDLRTELGRDENTSCISSLRLFV